MRSNSTTVAIAVRRSLEEVHASVSTEHTSFFRRLFAFAGPAFLVSVGYMDPGNWATDIAGGSQYGYSLLWVLVMSNLMALFLQTLAARMGIVGGRDLAQACRDLYPRPIRFALWVLCEVAIAACDLAEVIGTIVGLHLLFKIPFLWGLVITVLDTFFLLAIQRFGIRAMEAFILSLVFMIGLCFGFELFFASPVWSDVFGGVIPTLTSKAPFVFTDTGALYIAIGILGATVMPHNLYLHSALVQSRAVEKTEEGMAMACRYNFIDSFVALNAAFFVNASILILAAAAFSSHGILVDGIEEAHRLLPQFLGEDLAATLFAVALLCSGQSSTLTGTLAGQIVMEGFLSFRMQPWLRRLLTRSIAILPAAITILFFGESRLQDLLVLSQVVLSLQLPFAIIPLLRYTNDPLRMGRFRSTVWMRCIGAIIASIILGLNAYLVIAQVQSWRALLPSLGYSVLWIDAVVIPLCILVVALILYLIIEQFIYTKIQRSSDTSSSRVLSSFEGLTSLQPRRIGVALDHTIGDALTLRHAVDLAVAARAELVLLHIVDGVGAQWHGSDARDEEQLLDTSYLDQLATALSSNTLIVRTCLRYGRPSDELVSIVDAEDIDLLVVRSHGHGFFLDRLFGHTIDRLRHRIKIPILVVNSSHRSR